MTFEHEFVAIVPETLAEGRLYVCLPHNTCLHKCACGCGEEVVTPLSPGGWAVKYNGRSVSLSPSIGNWALSCRSHYWIGEGRIRWAGDWTDDRIASQRTEDSAAMRQDYETTTSTSSSWWKRFTGLFN